MIVSAFRAFRRSSVCHHITMGEAGVSDTQSSYFDLISSVASWYIFPGIDGGFHSPEFIFTSIVPLIHAVPAGLPFRH